MCTINSILSKNLDKEAIEIISNKIKSEMISGASLYVSTLRWIEDKFGRDIIEEIHEYQIERTVAIWKEKKNEFKDNSLDAFCKYMENSCVVTHKWKKIIDKKDIKSYKFTRCMWAEVFRELSAEDIGFWICKGDEPAAAAFNPQIKFKRTKTLMQGNDCCDHVFYIENED